MVSGNPDGQTGTLIGANTAASRQIDPTAQAVSQGLADYAGAKNAIYGQYSYLTGGPNWGLINQLRGQDKAAQKRYKTNRADVENMYGELTSDVKADTEALGQSYDTGMTESANRAQGIVTGLSGELAAQDQRRNAVAQSLGIGKEAALTDFGSTTALNEAMGTVLGQNQNWQGFLQSQKGTALQQGANIAAGVTNTQNQMTTEMKKEYDRVHDYYTNAINNEKSKQAVRKLTEEGKMLLGMEKSRLKQVLTENYGLSTASANKFVKAEQDLTGYFDTIPSQKWQSPSTFNGVDPTTGNKTWAATPQGWHEMMRANYIREVQSAKGLQGGAQNGYLLNYAEKAGLSPGDVLANTSGQQTPATSYTGYSQTGP